MDVLRLAQVSGGCDAQDPEFPDAAGHSPHCGGFIILCTFPSQKIHLNFAKSMDIFVKVCYNVTVQMIMIVHPFVNKASW